mmetsp:Transcript_12883/g.1960  ORF Transcript_12883/g.1960 Transcript_12883/m.1960 type:complete len:89 (+) Transcript_12883:115-381(+)
MVNDFTRSEITSNASTWDKNKEFPIPTFKKAAELGLCSLYISPDNGGSGLSRLDSSIVFEALGAGCNSTACYISIHNMCNGIIDTFGS